VHSIFYFIGYKWYLTIKSLQKLKGSCFKYAETRGCIGWCKEAHITAADSARQGRWSSWSLSTILKLIGLQFIRCTGKPGLNSAFVYLVQLNRCYLQAQDYSERLKSSEQELKVRINFLFFPLHYCIIKAWRYRICYQLACCSWSSIPLHDRCQISCL